MGSSKQKKMSCFSSLRKSRSKYHSGFLCTVKKNHPHHQNFEISFHRFFCFLYKHEQQRPQHSSLCIYFVSSVQHVIILICRRKKNYPVCLFHELFLIFLVSFFANRLNTTAAPHIILIFVLEKT